MQTIGSPVDYKKHYTYADYYAVNAEPYRIIYYIKPDQIDVVAVIYNSQDIPH